MPKTALRLATALLVSALGVPAAYAAEISVKNATELGAALTAAKAGDTVVLEDGVYNATGFACAQSGTAAMPITVKARNPLGATVRMDALEGFKVSGAYWHFEDFVVQGVCAVDSSCEHAFHVFGAADGFLLRRMQLRDFNAQLKVNSSQDGSGKWLTPNRGLIEGNELFDSRARNTSNPTTKLNIDTGDDWIVRANYLHDFQKGGGDGISYGAFMKSGGKRGLYERNLVICSRLHSGGTRIGLSFGGGGTAPQFCAPAFSAAVPCDVEHDSGILRNNVIVNCSDVGIYLNRGKNTHVLYNTLIATSGVDFRFATTSGEARGNALTGTVRLRDGATGTFANNIENIAQATFTSYYQAPLLGDLRKKGDLSALIGAGPLHNEVPDDYCARTRSAPYDVGALQHSLGDCDTTRPPLPMGGGPGPTPDGGTGSSGDGGTGGSGDGGDPSPAQETGCSCTLGRAATPTNGAPGLALLGLGAVAFLLRRRARG
ncbi:MAG: chondroitinase-B domain-containing protein [Polyangia bacterium]